MIIRELLDADGKPAGVQTEPQAQTAAQKKYDDDEVNAILARNKEKYAKEGAHLFYQHSGLSLQTR